MHGVKSLGGQCQALGKYLKKAATLSCMSVGTGLISLITVSLGGVRRSNGNPWRDRRLFVGEVLGAFEKPLL